MNRLTKRVDGIAVLESWAIDKDPVSIIQRLCNRLTAYEDSGLEPEEIKKHEAAYNECLTRTYGPFKQKISQWLQAEQDGRLVVLPCKVGDTVWVVFSNGLRPYVVDRLYVMADSKVMVRMRHMLTETLRISGDEFGKTVFLTREEAEAALAQEGGTHEADSV